MENTKFWLVGLIIIMFTALSVLLGEQNPMIMLISPFFFAFVFIRLKKLLNKKYSFKYANKLILLLVIITFIHSIGAAIFVAATPLSKASQVNPNNLNAVANLYDDISIKNSYIMLDSMLSLLFLIKSICFVVIGYLVFKHIGKPILHKLLALAFILKGVSSLAVCIVTFSLTDFQKFNSINTFLMKFTTLFSPYSDSFLYVLLIIMFFKANKITINNESNQEI